MSILVTGATGTIVGDLTDVAATRAARNVVWEMLNAKS